MVIYRTQINRRTKSFSFVQEGKCVFLPPGFSISNAVKKLLVDSSHTWSAFIHIHRLEQRGTDDCAKIKREIEEEY